MKYVLFVYQLYFNKTALKWPQLTDLPSQENGSPKAAVRLDPDVASFPCPC
jgi:hypothetical protein